MNDQKTEYDFKKDLSFSEKREQEIINEYPQFTLALEKKKHDLDLDGVDPITCDQKNYTVEVKTDRRCCGVPGKNGTGRISFETEYKGQPSGIFKGNFQILIYDIPGKGKLFFTDIKSLQNFVTKTGTKIGLLNSTINYLVNYALIEQAVLSGEIRNAGGEDWFRVFFFQEEKMSEDEYAKFCLENYL